MEVKRVRVAFRGQLRSVLGLKPSRVLINKMAQPTVSEFASHLHEQFAMKDVCKSVDIKVEDDKYINSAQHTSCFQDDELLTVIPTKSKAPTVTDEKGNQNTESVDTSLRQLTSNLDYEDPILKTRLSKQRITVNEMSCPRVDDLATYLVRQLEISDICPRGISLKIGNYFLHPQESMYVVRNGETVTISIVQSRKRKTRPDDQPPPLLTDSETTPTEEAGQLTQQPTGRLRLTEAEGAESTEQQGEVRRTQAANTESAERQAQVGRTKAGHTESAKGQAEVGRAETAQGQKDVGQSQDSSMDILDKEFGRHMGGANYIG